MLLKLEIMPLEKIKSSKEKHKIFLKLCTIPVKTTLI